MSRTLVETDFTSRKLFDHSEIDSHFAKNAQLKRLERKRFSQQESCYEDSNSRERNERRVISPGAQPERKSEADFRMEELISHSD